MNYVSSVSGEPYSYFDLMDELGKEKSSVIPVHDRDTVRTMIHKGLPDYFKNYMDKLDPFTDEMMTGIYAKLEEWHPVLYKKLTTPLPKTDN